MMEYLLQSLYGVDAPAGNHNYRLNKISYILLNNEHGVCFRFRQQNPLFRDTKFPFQDTIYPVSRYKLSCFGNKWLCGQAFTQAPIIHHSYK